MARGRKRFFITKDELERHLKTKTYIQIGKEFGVNHGSVRWAAKKHGLLKASRIWSTEEIEALRGSYYAGKLSMKSRRSLSGSYHKASRLGIRKQIWKRKYTLDEDFIKNWSSSMAYVYGWLCSDGSVGWEKMHIGFHIHSQDGYILHKIKDVTSYNGPVFQRGKYSELKIASKSLVADVVLLGCTPRKSWTLCFPDVPEELLPHFVRGYFDGDGSIMFNKPNVIKISFLGSEEFLQALRLRLFYALGVKLNSITLGNIYRLHYYGDDARKVCTWMYADAQDLYLKRKKERFDKHIELRKQKWHTNKSSC